MYSMSEAYRIDFEDLKIEYVQLFIDVAEIIERDETVTMEKLKRFLSHYHELKASLASAGTIVDLFRITHHSPAALTSNMLLDILKLQQQLKKSKATSNMWTNFAHKN